MKSSSFIRATVETLKRSLPILLLLRKPDSAFSLQLSVNQPYNLENKINKNDVEVGQNNNSYLNNLQSAKMAGGSGKNGLILYYNEYSFYSQKVVMALHEKHLPFEPYNIELTGEQYQPWFLQINPKGEVPVLQDTGKIIPDSARIIDYLEDNFSNGDTPRLVPQDQGADLRQKMNHFRNLIDKINGNVLTIGSLLHPELASGAKKVPFIGPVRNQLLTADKESAEKLRKYAEENPSARQMLLEKAENQEKKRAKLLDKDEFLKILKETEIVFDKVEAELSEHETTGGKFIFYYLLLGEASFPTTNESGKKVDEASPKNHKDWWLCSDIFSIADVSLTILMVRINQIGMEPYFWADGKRPLVEKYFQRVQQRDSYKRTVPTTFSLIKTIFKTQTALVLGVSIATAVILVVGGWFLVRKCMLSK